MEPTDLKDKVRALALIADDFFLLLAISRLTHGESPADFFLMAHSIELCSKACLLSVHGEVRTGHNIEAILDEVCLLKPSTSTLRPTLQDYQEYKTLWIPSKARSPLIISNIPEPEVLDAWELAFSLDHITAHKYSLDKHFEQVSLLNVSRPGYINKKYASLFKSIRDIYSTPELDSYFSRRVLQVFREGEAGDRIRGLLNISTEQ